MSEKLFDLAGRVALVTGAGRGMGLAVGRTGTPEDVGAAAADLVSNQASWMTGQVLPLNGGAITA